LKDEDDFLTIICIVIAGIVFGGISVVAVISWFFIAVVLIFIFLKERMDEKSKKKFVSCGG